MKLALVSHDPITKEKLTMVYNYDYNLRKYNVILVVKLVIVVLKNPHPNNLDYATCMKCKIILL